MSTPEISVIIPVHNAADTLIEQLDAVRVAQAQAPASEILVIDNRSSDGSGELARQWADDHDIDLRLIDASERAGEPYARNVGLAAARAERIVYCDADDRVAPTWLRAMADALGDAPYATGPIDMDALNPEWLANVRGSSVTGRSLMYDRVPFAHGCNMGFRRAPLEAVGGFDEAFTAGCDLDVAIRMWAADHDMAYVDDALIHYRLRPSLGETYRQGHFYGRYRMPIRRRLAEVGVSTDERGRNARRVLWLARRAPVAVLRRATRARWVWVAGQLVGEARGRRDLRGRS